jgi:hypothetical protein
MRKKGENSVNFAGAKAGIPPDESNDSPFGDESQIGERVSVLESARQ